MPGFTLLLPQIHPGFALERVGGQAWFPCLVGDHREVSFLPMAQVSTSAKSHPAG